MTDTDRIELYWKILRIEAVNDLSHKSAILLPGSRRALLVEATKASAIILITDGSRIPSAVMHATAGDDANPPAALVHGRASA